MPASAAVPITGKLVDPAADSAADQTLIAQVSPPTDQTLVAQVPTPADSAIAILNELWIFVAHGVESGHKARIYHYLSWFRIAIVTQPWCVYRHPNKD